LPLALKRPIRSAELEVRPARHRFGRLEKAKALGEWRPSCGVASDAGSKLVA